MGEPLFVLLILGEPVPKGRPRMTRSGRPYTPSATVEAEHRVIREFQSQFVLDEPLMGDLRVVMEFQSRKTKRGGVNRASDLDNYVKLILDALNGVAFVDDVQIVSMSARVLRCADLEPFTRLEVWEDVLDRCSGSGREGQTHPA